MLYIEKITAASNTPQSNPASVEISVEEKAILYIAVRIPPGHRGLTGVSVWYGEEIIFPQKKYEWVTGDNEVVWDLILWECPEKPCPLTIKMYNTDATYDHTAIVHIVSCDLVVLYGLKFLGKLVEGVDKFLKLVGVS